MNIKNFKKYDCVIRIDNNYHDNTYKNEFVKLISKGLFGNSIKIRNNSLFVWSKDKLNINKLDKEFLKKTDWINFAEFLKDFKKDIKYYVLKEFDAIDPANGGAISLGSSHGKFLVMNLHPTYTYLALFDESFFNYFKEATDIAQLMNDKLERYDRIIFSKKELLTEKTLQEYQDYADIVHTISHNDKKFERCIEYALLKDIDKTYKDINAEQFRDIYLGKRTLKQQFERLFYVEESPALQLPKTIGTLEKEKAMTQPARKKNNIKNSDFDRDM